VHPPRHALPAHPPLREDALRLPSHARVSSSTSLVQLVSPSSSDTPGYPVSPSSLGTPRYPVSPSSSGTLRYPRLPVILGHPQVPRLPVILGHPQVPRLPVILGHPEGCTFTPRLSHARESPRCPRDAAQDRTFHARAAAERFCAECSGEAPCRPAARPRECVRGAKSRSRAPGWAPGGWSPGSARGVTRCCAVPQGSPRSRPPEQGPGARADGRELPPAGSVGLGGLWTGALAAASPSEQSWPLQQPPRQSGPEAAERRVPRRQQPARNAAARKTTGQGQTQRGEEPELGSQVRQASGARGGGAAPSSGPLISRDGGVVTASGTPCPPASKYRKETRFSSEAQHKEPSRRPWGGRARQRQNSWATQSKAFPSPRAPRPSQQLGSGTKYLLK